MSKRLVHGIGINDAGYAVHIQEIVGYVNGKRKQKLVWTCPFYQTWNSMLSRCYSKEFKARQPTYVESATIEQWQLFSNFKAWMEKQDYEGKQLDKDLLVQGNKLYSPATCVFISRQVNMFVTEQGAARGDYMIGVNWHKQTSKFVARCSNPFTGKQEYLGLFLSELEAHKAWLKRKLEHAYTLAAIQTDERVAKALIERYTNYSEQLQGE